MDPMGCQTYPPGDELRGRSFFIESVLSGVREDCFTKSERRVDRFGSGDILWLACNFQCLDRHSKLSDLRRQIVCYRRR